MTGIITRKNGNNLETPLDTTRPFMDDKRLSISGTPRDRGDRQLFPFSGIAAVSTAESRWPLSRLVLAAERVAASNPGHLGPRERGAPTVGS